MTATVDSFTLVHSEERTCPSDLWAAWRTGGSEDQTAALSAFAPDAGHASRFAVADIVGQHRCGIGAVVSAFGDRARACIAGEALVEHSRSAKMLECLVSCGNCDAIVGHIAEMPCIGDVTDEILVRLLRFRPTEDLTQTIVAKFGSRALHLCFEVGLSSWRTLCERGVSPVACDCWGHWPIITLMYNIENHVDDLGALAQYCRAPGTALLASISDALCDIAGGAGGWIHVATACALLRNMGITLDTTAVVRMANATGADDRVVAAIVDITPDVCREKIANTLRAAASRSIALAMQVMTRKRAREGDDSPLSRKRSTDN
ncbi:MAG: hypothetical protein WC732_08510 [Candidatus Omnitrophota bacterium]